MGQKFSERLAEMSHVSSGGTDRFRIVEPRSPIYAESNTGFAFQVQNPLGSEYLNLFPTHSPLQFNGKRVLEAEFNGKSPINFFWPELPQVFNLIQMLLQPLLT